MTSFRLRRGSFAALLLLSLALTMLAGTHAPASGAAVTGKTVQLSTSDKRVRPNETVTVRGRFRPLTTEAAPVGDKADDGAQPVRIQFRALGSRYWRAVRSTRAGRAGRFSGRVRVERSGRVRAVSADGRVTAARKIRVRSITRARVERRAKVGQKVAIRGRVVPAGPRRRVTVTVGGERIRTHTGRGGRFSAKWKPRRATRSQPGAPTRRAG
jgi:hypothetical protein